MPRDAQVQHGAVSVQHGSDGGVGRIGRPQLAGQIGHAFAVGQVAAHHHVGNGNLQAGRAQGANAFDRAAQRAGKFGDAVVNFRAVGINADLHLLDAESAEAAGFRLADEHGVGFHLHVEQQSPGAGHDVEEIAADHGFAAAQGQEENPGISELGEQPRDLLVAHLAFVVVLEVAMLAALVAPVCEVHMDGQGHAQAECLADELFHQAHRASPDAAAACAVGGSMG